MAFCLLSVLIRFPALYLEVYISAEAISQLTGNSFQIFMIINLAFKSFIKPKWPTFYGSSFSNVCKCAAVYVLYHCKLNIFCTVGWTKQAI